MLYAVTYTQNVLGSTFDLTLFYATRKRAEACRSLRDESDRVAEFNSCVIAGPVRRATIAELLEKPIRFDPIRIPRV